MLDDDEISPWASWSDDRIRRWAYSRGLDRYPIAKVPLWSVLPDVDVAIIRFDQAGAPVSRECSRLDSFDKEEWWDVCRKVKPNLSRDVFEVMWLQFARLKQAKQLQ